MPKQSYWIADPDGVKALVVGADQRDVWTKVRGWSETTEPSADDRIHLQNTETGGRTVLRAEAVGGVLGGLGWVPAAPPEPVDLTKDPALIDQAPPVAAAPSTTSASTPAASADTTKE